jgi:hypothetical protein
MIAQMRGAHCQQHHRLLARDDRHQHRGRPDRANAGDFFHHRV